MSKVIYTPINMFAMTYKAHLSENGSITSCHSFKTPEDYVDYLTHVGPDKVVLIGGGAPCKVLQKTFKEYENSKYSTNKLVYEVTDQWHI